MFATTVAKLYRETTQSDQGPSNFHVLRLLLQDEKLPSRELYSMDDRRRAQ